MSFKWPGVPSPRAEEHELADYAELLAWKSGSTSLTELSRVLGRLDDNDHSMTSDPHHGDPFGMVVGGVREEDATYMLSEEAFAELDRRLRACSDGYPYSIGHQGYTLDLDVGQDGHRQLLYNFLLLATRLDMAKMRNHVGVDGTELFEKVGALTARAYLGCRADSLAFDRSPAPFKERVENLCRRLGEGGGYLDRFGGSSRVQDGKLDVVAWKPFSDRRKSKLIAFGQCKTGTSYKDSLTQLQPDSFLNKWVRDSLLPPPVRMFFVSEALPDSGWGKLTADAGLLFDRCRVVDFVDVLDAELLTDVIAWTNAAAMATGLRKLQMTMP